MPTLTWLTREHDLKTSRNAPYRLLEEVSELSAGAAKTENMLIHGDNLDALKALLPYFAGQVKCVSIDPPFNTEQAFEHYDDNLEHSIWLAVMQPWGSKGDEISPSTLPAKMIGMVAPG